MSRLLDANGKPLDPIERAMADMEAAVEEAIFGTPPDERVRLLRESVLGDREPSRTLRGLSEALP